MAVFLRAIGGHDRNTSGVSNTEEFRGQYLFPCQRNPSFIHAFLTNSDFNCIAPMPSILQSISWSPEIMRMFLTLVPTLTTDEDPFIFRSLMTVTESPSLSTLPKASRTTLSATALSAATFGHSWEHSGQTYISPSS